MPPIQNHVQISQEWIGEIPSLHKIKKGAMSFW